MLKSFKYRIEPSKNKTNKLNQTRRICHWFYNFLNRLRIELWEQEQKQINYYQQQKLLPKIKEQHLFLKKVHSQTLQDVADRINKAWQPFYKKQKKIANLERKLLELLDGKKSEKLKGILEKCQRFTYPRKKEINRYHSFTYTQNNSFELIKSQLKLERKNSLWINVIKHRELEGTPKTCSLLTKNEKWYTTISCEVESQPKLDSKLITLNKQIGIDVNTSKNNFIVLSNGKKVNNPHFYQETEKQLSKLAKQLSLKKHRRNKEDKTKSSKNYKKGRLHFAKQAERVSNKRLDFVFQEVSKLKKVMTSLELKT